MKIGELTWRLEKKTNYYKNNISLKSRGLLGSMYSFSGSYMSTGYLKEGGFISKKYSHKWVTKKKKKTVRLKFKNTTLTLLEQLPTEKELPRIKLFEISEHVDPLSSFLNILSDKQSSKTIDGRRLYTMYLVKEKEGSKEKTVVIKNYKNIWADHKRNDLKKITFIQSQNKILPDIIKIFFKGSVFKLQKN